jgi:Lhr-like helicase
MAPNVLDSTGFHPLINRWFRQRFANPSPPQQRGWPSIAAAKHTLILAPTGSGKTLAAFLWRIDRLFRRSLNAESHQFAQNPWGIHTLYISPLKAISNNKRGVHLSLSLERMIALCRSEPIRIGLSATQKPLDRIAAFLGGQTYDMATRSGIPRPLDRWWKCFAASLPTSRCRPSAPD